MLRALAMAVAPMWPCAFANLDQLAARFELLCARRSRGTHENVRGQMRPRGNPNTILALKLFGPKGSGAPMAHEHLLSLVANLRARAEELLLRAETMRDADARLRIREIAAGYDKLAQRIEQRSLKARNVLFKNR
jgi:hypothetical protein